MVSKLFDRHHPTAGSRVLDPGCGNGEFIAGILRWCNAHQLATPEIVGVELDSERASVALRRFVDCAQVSIVRADFLGRLDGVFDYVIGNPPYVSIVGLSVDERVRYRSSFLTAQGRFDLYALFFEQALRLLAPSGRLVFITPEKFTYVETARPLREILSARGVEELHYFREDAFSGYVTYPLITTVSRRRGIAPARIISRAGAESLGSLPGSASWMPAVSGFVGESRAGAGRLVDYAQRISCGVATGADSVFVIPQAVLTPALAQFAFPTISGRQISAGRALATDSYLLAPYAADGSLLSEGKLGELGTFLRQPMRRSQLEARTCAARKPWYAFHDNLPLRDVLRPKILCKDIGAEPVFVVDRSGDIVPRHSVYYIVPRDPADLDPIAEYLESSEARAWLRAHCQRAANGFLRVQSHVLKQLPIPSGRESQLRGRRDVPEQAELLPA